MAVLITVLFGLKFYVTKYNEWIGIGKPLKFSKMIEFTGTSEKIYIHTAIWGLTGDHFHIYISHAQKGTPEEPIDLILSDCLEAYYKLAEPDTLYIYRPVNVGSKESTKRIGNINIILKEEILPPKRESALFRISVYDGIE